MPEFRSWQSRYAMAVVSVLAAFTLRISLSPVLDDRAPFLTLPLAVAVSAWFGGIGPGALALLASSLGAAYFFVSPVDSFGIHGASGWANMAMHLLVGGVFLVLTDQLRLSDRRLRQEALRLQQEVEQRRQAQAALHAQREQLSVTLSSIGDAVLVADDEGRIRSFNPIAEVMTGWKQPEVVGRPLPEVVEIRDETTGESVESLLDRVMTSDGVCRTVNHAVLRGRSGSETIIEHSVAPIMDRQGRRTGVVLVLRDVTQRRRAEAILRESEARFRALADSAPVLIWMAGLDKQGTYFSRPWLEFRGRTLEQEQGNGWLEGVHPDDYQHCIDIYFTAFDARESFHMDYRLQRHDGAYRWVLDTGTPRYQADGTFAGYIGSCIDITERKEAAERLRQQEQWLRVTLGSIGDAVIATDINARVTFLNTVASRLTGWSEEAAVGRPLDEVFEIRNERTRRGIESPVAKALRDGSIVGLANHTVLLAKDGTEHPIDDSAAPIRDSSGNVVGVVLVFRDVAERRRAEEARLRLAAIVESSEDVIIGTSLDGRVNSWNAGAARLYGYSADEVHGKPIALLDCKDDHILLADAIEQLGRGQRVEPFEASQMRKNGTCVDVSARVSPVKDAEGTLIGTSVILRDISDQKRRERANRFLADATAELASLVDFESTLQRLAALAVPGFADWCSVVVVEEDSSLRRVAMEHADPQRLAQLCEMEQRYPPEQLRTAILQPVLNTGEPLLISDVPLEFVKTVAQDEAHFEFLRGFGLHSLMALPLTVRGRMIGIISFGLAESNREFSSFELSIAQDLLHRAASAIDNARLYSELRDADRRKDEFLAMLAHELRNPLAPIRNAVVLLRLDDLDEETGREALDIMDRQVEHMARLVDDLLDVSRIMRGKIELRKEWVSLHTVVQRAVETARPAIDAQGHELIISLPQSTVWIEGDSIRLSQAIANLLNNAAKFTESGGRIELSARSENHQIVIEVRDNGIGIDRELLPHIFDLFSQADRSIERARGGLGIGLTLVRQLIEMHGGTVMAESPGLGQGTTFSIRLPEAVGRANGLPQAVPCVAGAPPRRVLVVDDNQGSANLLAVLLRTLGSERVERAYDGMQALERAVELQPDLVLLDIGLPGMNGYEVAERLRQMPNFDRTLLVALTGYGQAEDRRRALEAGFDEHLVKPASVEALQALFRHPKLAGDFATPNHVDSGSAPRGE